METEEIYFYNSRFLHNTISSIIHLHMFVDSLIQIQPAN